MDISDAPHDERAVVTPFPPRQLLPAGTPCGSPSSVPMLVIERNNKTGEFRCSSSSVTPSADIGGLGTVKSDSADTCATTEDASLRPAPQSRDAAHSVERRSRKGATASRELTAGGREACYARHLRAGSSLAAAAAAQSRRLVSAAAAFERPSGQLTASEKSAAEAGVRSTPPIILLEDTSSLANLADSLDERSCRNLPGLPPPSSSTNVSSASASASSSLDDLQGSPLRQASTSRRPPTGCSPYLMIITWRLPVANNLSLRTQGPWPHP